MEHAPRVQPAHPFVRALAELDFAAIEALLDQGVKFRALIPPGLREASGPQDATALIRRWFGECEDIGILSSSSGQVGDRHSVAYRLRVKEGGAYYVVAQQVFCTLKGGKIAEMDLLCSGFRPEAE